MNKWQVEFRSVLEGPPYNLAPIHLIWTDPPVAFKTQEMEDLIRSIWTPYLADSGVIIFNPKNNQVDWYAWVESQILEYTNPGELVVDPFCGESTTGLAAIRNGRTYYGCDVSRRVLDISREKLQSVHAHS